MDEDQAPPVPIPGHPPARVCHGEVCVGGLRGEHKSLEYREGFSSWVLDSERT